MKTNSVTIRSTDKISDDIRLPVPDVWKIHMCTGSDLACNVPRINTENPIMEFRRSKS